MTLPTELRLRWQRILDLLRQYDPPLLAAISDHHSWSTDDELQQLLVSNELWGGSGSIADQAGVKTGRTAQRREIEQALVELGSEQIRLGKVNGRTEMWVSAFQKMREV